MAVETVVCFSFSLASQEPMAYVRLIAPFKHLGIRIIDGLRYYEEEELEKILAQGDVVILQREFPIQFGKYQKILESARSIGKPVVFELDDLLFFLPKEHPDRQKHYYAPALLPMLQAVMEVDAVVVSTPGLGDVLHGFNDNIFVIPNYLDDTLWQLRPPQFSAPSSPVTIGYMGTNSHKYDLEYVAPVLLNLLRKYSNQISLRFWGIRPPELLLEFPCVEWIPSEYRSYEDFAFFFQNQQADVFISPLVGNIFNKCKSHLKFLEYTALGAPGVFSRLEPYERVVRHGQNGLLAYSLDEWERALSQLIEDAELRYRIAIQAQATVRENWLLSKNASRWREALQDILECKRKDRAITRLSVFSSINTQLLEAFHALSSQVEAQQQTIRALSSQVEAQQQTIQELSDEILSLVLSRSWRWTRPFRIISKKLKTR